MSSCLARMSSDRQTPVSTVFDLLHFSSIFTINSFAKPQLGMPPLMWSSIAFCMIKSDVWFALCHLTNSFRCWLLLSVFRAEGCGCLKVIWNSNMPKCISICRFQVLKLSSSNFSILMRLSRCTTWFANPQVCEN